MLVVVLCELWESYVVDGYTSKWYLRALSAPFPRAFVIRNYFDGGNHWVAGVAAVIAAMFWDFSLRGNGYPFSPWWLIVMYIILGMILMIFCPPPGKQIAMGTSEILRENWITYWMVEGGLILGLFVAPWFQI